MRERAGCRIAAALPAPSLKIGPVTNIPDSLSRIINLSAHGIVIFLLVITLIVDRPAIIKGNIKLDLSAERYFFPYNRQCYYE